MTDTLAVQFAARQIELELAALRRDTARLAEDARLYAATVNDGHPGPGDANRLVQAAIQVAQQAARLNGIRETAAYLSPATGDPR